MIRINFFLLLVFLWVWAAGASCNAQELRRIHYGTTVSISHLPVWVAKDAGFFAKKGLNVEPVQIRGGALITMGIMSGQLQISVAALNIRYALPFLRRNWPVLVELTKTDLIYPSSCVTSSRTFVKSEPRVAEDFLSAYVTGIQLIKKDPKVGERSLAKWSRENDAYVLTKSVEAHARIFKSAPYVPDKGIENVMKDL